LIKQEYNKDNAAEVTLLEMRARLLRMANSLPKKENDHSLIHLNEISQVERIAIYIAQNYSKPIKVSDIGKAVGLHPDYANAIFKKAFGSTLSEYITEERISHAQRKLVVTTSRITEIAFACGFRLILRKPHLCTRYFLLMAQLMIGWLIWILRRRTFSSSACNKRRLFGCLLFWLV